MDARLRWSGAAAIQPVPAGVSSLRLHHLRASPLKVMTMATNTAQLPVGVRHEARSDYSAILSAPRALLVSSLSTPA